MSEDHARRVLAKAGVTSIYERAEKKRAAATIKGGWQDDSSCIKNPSTGKLLPVLANLLIALRHDPDLKDKIAYDEIQRTAMWRRMRPVIDEDVGKVQEHLQQAGLSRVSKDTVHQAVDCYARERTYHPVK